MRRTISLCLLSLVLAGWLALPARPAQAASSPAELLDAVNALRTGQGLGALQADPALMAAAQAHSDYQAANGDASHTGAGVSSPGGRATAAGYGGGARVFVVENIYSGAGASAQNAVSWWSSDGPHWAAMMNASAVHGGAGAAEADGVVYYTLLVGYVTGQEAQPPAPQIQAPTAAPQSPARVAAPVAQQETAVPINPVITATPGENGAVVHTVAAGETLFTIAEAYEIPLADLLAQNGLQPNAVIFPGETLVIRAGATPTPTGPPTATATATDEPTPTRRARTPVARTRTPAPALTQAPTPAPTDAASAPFAIPLTRRTLGAILIVVSLLGLAWVGWRGFRGER